MFTVTAQRKPEEDLDLVSKSDEILMQSTPKTSGKILASCRKKSSITIPELAQLIGITERSVQRNIQKLQTEGFIRRIGGRKEGYWEALEP